MQKLTEKELRILYHLCCGEHNDEIAKKVYKSVHTVKIYVGTLLKKLNARNRTEAVFKACQDKDIMDWLMNENKENNDNNNETNDSQE